MGVSPDSLTGAPEAVRERVALRCLQEVVSLASSDGERGATASAIAAPGEGMLGVEDASRTCEDLLLQLIREVRYSAQRIDIFASFDQVLSIRLLENSAIRFKLFVKTR